MGPVIFSRTTDGGWNGDFGGRRQQLNIARALIAAIQDLPANREGSMDYINSRIPRCAIPHQRTPRARWP
jgi:hypothetical protein